MTGIKSPPNASTSKKGEVRIATPPADPNNPKVAGDNDPRVGIPNADELTLGRVKLSLPPVNDNFPVLLGDNDPRVSDNAFDGEVEELFSAPGNCTIVPGILGEDLWIACGNTNPASPIKASVWRMRPGEDEFTMVSSYATEPEKWPGGGVVYFSSNNDWGAIEFDGKLYIGSYAAGTCHRLNLNDDGTLIRLERADLAPGFRGDGGAENWSGEPIGSPNGPGGEDCHPGVVLWGYLWICTYGWGGSNGPWLRRFEPGMFRSEGIVHATYIGEGGLMNSMTVYDGAIWSSAMDQNQYPNTKTEIYRVEPDGSYEVVYHALDGGYLIRTWGEDLIAYAVTYRANGPGAMVWRGDHFEKMDEGPIMNPYAYIGMGDHIAIINYYRGLGFSSRGKSPNNLAVGLPDWVGFPAVYKDGSINDGSATAPSANSRPVVWNGRIIWTSSANRAGVWAAKIGEDHLMKQLTHERAEQAGMNPTSRFISDDPAKGMVLRSPDSHYRRLTVNNAGVLSLADLGTGRPGS